MTPVSPPSPVSAEGPRYRQARIVLSRDIPGETLLAVPGRDDVDVVTGTAREAWTLLEVPRTLHSVVSRLTDAYQAPDETVAEDVEALIGQLLSRDLVEKVVDSDV